MEFVKTIEDLKKNMQTLDEYIDKKCDPEYSYAMDLIRRGLCFITIEIKYGYRFYPSRFIGYAENTMDKHLNNDERSGLKTNPIINSILKESPSERSDLENEYTKYCKMLGVEKQNRKHKFWTIS